MITHDNLVDRLAKLAVEKGWTEDEDDVVSVQVEGVEYDTRLGSILAFLARKLPAKRHYNFNGAVNVDVYTKYDMIQYTVVEGDGTQEHQEDDFSIVLGVL